MAEASAAAKIDRPNEYSQASVDTLMLTTIQYAQDIRKKKHGELQSAFKTAELRGTNPDAAKTALKLAKGGVEAIDEYFKQIKLVGTYLDLLGKTLAPAQYEMFGPKIGPVPEEERATKEGRFSGFSLDPEMTELKNPYDPVSTKGQAWIAGFRQARSERDGIMAMQPPKVEPNPDDEGDED